MLGVCPVVEVGEAPARDHGLAPAVLVAVPGLPRQTGGLDVRPLAELHLLRQHQHADVVLVTCVEPSEVERKLDYGFYCS